MNSRRLHWLLWAVFFLLVVMPARSCGPDWPEAVFVKKDGPDGSYAAFARGRIGVPQNQYRTRHLVVVYRTLSGQPLSPEEQAEAVRVNDFYRSNWMTDQKEAAQLHPGYFAWIGARQAFGPIDGFAPTNLLAGQDAWENAAYFEGCQDDAFATAARTLADRAKIHGGHSADVTEWMRGQDAVFHNCAKQGVNPAALPRTSPAWLRQDRAYQQAAALFYQQKYEDAVAGFRTIAADTASPWSVLSRYLMGRIFAERATSAENFYPMPNADTSAQPKPEQRLTAYLDHLSQARTELLTMRAEPRMAPMAHAIDALLDRVNARLEPEQQMRTLAMRITTSHQDATFYQDVLDLSYLADRSDEVEDPALKERPRVTPPPPANEAERRADDLIAWIQAFHREDEATSVAAWQTSHSTPWLVAALSAAKPNDPSTPELLAAAAKVLPSDPAYAAATYQRLRLLPSAADMRHELLAALPKLPAESDTSTKNLYSQLNAQAAPDLETWLRQAARKPADDVEYGDEGPDPVKPGAQPCGPALRPLDEPLFPADSATILNTRLPLRLLEKAALSSILPPNVRFQVAQAAWTRAVLLDRRAVAMRLAPVLIGCNAKWKPVLDDYAHAAKAATVKDRQAAKLFALMRFASTEPNVREGFYRPDGFAAYSLFRDNWWCFTASPDQPKPEELSHFYDENGGWGYTMFAHPEIPDPAFLTAVDKAETEKEIAALRAIPKASVYFSEQAFAWQKSYPRDPRTPELLGQAFRVVRNACGDKTSSETEHKLFLVLHQQYPESPWTKRYKSWD